MAAHTVTPGCRRQPIVGEYATTVVFRCASPGCAIETSRNITARVIERDTSGEIYYFLEDSRGFRTHQHGRQK
ncbi:hypothetical protein TNCV_305681 [Trichonephila clavipes]|nr:hypothetical protein TNCV_305681 [Trichonephila clavipes]